MGLVVCVGASAGGLEALGKLIQNLPKSDLYSYVVIQHLSPDYKSMMRELLSKFTDKPIVMIENGTEVKEGVIYLLPPKKQVRIISGILYLSDFDAAEPLHLPIDTFLTSLSVDQGETATAIILSGTGSDGTRGVIAIRNHDGLVMVQDPSTAQFNGMPSSAIATGLVNYILPPEEMGEKLMDYINQFDLTSSPMIKLRLQLPPDESFIQKIYTLIQRHIDLDLTYYKQNTILRRIERRMTKNSIELVGDYYAHLLNDPNELEDMCNELLIGVTQFFRDPAAFQLIGDIIIPLIAEGKKEELIRVWVAGCSTGQEAYTLAILFSEYFEKINRTPNVKIFASDFDPKALEIASAGLYASTIADEIPEALLRKYFIQTETGNLVVKDLRDMLIFSRHNIIKDPPFHKIDLLTCRNMLIYFQPIMQKKVLSCFKYALNQNGYLFLGPSETPGEYASAFIPIDNRWKVFVHKESPKFSRSNLEHQQFMQLSVQTSSQADLTYKPRGTGQFLDLLYRQLVHHFMPSAAVVDVDGNIILTCGDTNTFLKLPPGQPSINIAHMLDKRPAASVLTSLRKAFTENTMSKFRYVTKVNEADTTISVRIERLPDFKGIQPLSIVFFDKLKKEKNAVDYIQQTSEHDLGSIIQDLDRELLNTKENLQATVEALETSNEELQATNEELLSSNEELQSTNEELQAVNEELITLNAEYQQKILEMSDLNNDMDNFLRITNIGIIFLDKNLCIRKSTDEAEKIFNILPQDIGRSISHFSHNISNFDIIGEAQKVLDTLMSFVQEIMDRDGNQYLLKIYPFTTRENMVKGVTITFVDITELKTIQDKNNK